jgi:hypothetical protein
MTLLYVALFRKRTVAPSVSCQLSEFKEEKTVQKSMLAFLLVNLLLKYQVYSANSSNSNLTSCNPNNKVENRIFVLSEPY